MPTINFIWDDVSDNVLVETDENNQVTTTYIRHPEKYGEVFYDKQANRFAYYHYDGNGSTRKLTGANQAVTKTYIFTGFGELVASPRVGSTPFAYKGAAGYYTNPVTNDIYVRARTYEPTTGRWLSKDPLGFVDGPNLYGAYFVPDKVDPLGTNCRLTCDEWQESINQPIIIKPTFTDPGKRNTKTECSVRVVCSDSCPIPVLGQPPLEEAPGHTGQPDAARNILICISRKLTGDFQIILDHELVHAAYYCNPWRPPHKRPVPGTCDECRRYEEPAHAKSCQHLPVEKRDDCKECGVWRSCRKICKDPAPKNCSGWGDVGLGDPGIPW